MFRNLLTLLIPAVLSASVHVAHAIDVDDDETGAEEAMAESDATSEQARLAQRRAKLEQREAQTRAKQAEEMSARAEAKKQSAAKELATSESNLAKLRAETARLIKVRTRAEGVIAVEEGKLRVMTARLTKAQNELEAVTKQRAEREEHLAGLRKQIDDAKTGIETTTRTLAQQREELRQRAETQKSMDAEFARLKAQYKAVQEQSAAQGQQVARLRAVEQRKADQLNYAREQIKDANREPATKAAPAGSAAPSSAPTVVPNARPQSRGGSAPSAPSSSGASRGAPSTAPSSGDQ